jgi:hypothetical protein
MERPRCGGRIGRFAGSWQGVGQPGRKLGARRILGRCTVEDSGQGVVRVRLTDAEGRTFEDTVNDGVVLFISEEPVAMPMRVELYDEDGRVVATEEWGFRDA